MWVAPHLCSVFSLWGGNTTNSKQVRRVNGEEREESDRKCTRQEERNENGRTTLEKKWISAPTAVVKYLYRCTAFRILTMSLLLRGKDLLFLIFLFFFLFLSHPFVLSPLPAAFYTVAAASPAAAASGPPGVPATFLPFTTPNTKLSLTSYGCTFDGKFTRSNPIF